MSFPRAERLLALMQCLRRYRRPVSGARLAEELGVSLRTLYRDIASLRAHGANIGGEPGMGYVLGPGFLLPPLMFTATELEALMLGTRWVARRTDSELAQDARSALAKIAAVLPDDLRRGLDDPSLLIGTSDDALDGRTLLPVLRQAIRQETKLSIQYRDQQDRTSARVVWPFALGFFERVRILVAWCELRQETRHFRVDRLCSVNILPERYPQRRRTLLKRWREQEGIAPPC